MTIIEENMTGFSKQTASAIRAHSTNVVDALEMNTLALLCFSFCLGPAMN